METTPEPQEAPRPLSDADAYLLAMSGEADQATRERVRAMLDDPSSEWNQDIRRTLAEEASERDRDA